MPIPVPLCFCLSLRACPSSSVTYCIAITARACPTKALFHHRCANTFHTIMINTREIRQEMCKPLYLCVEETEDCHRFLLLMAAMASLFPDFSFIYDAYWMWGAWPAVLSVCHFSLCQQGIFVKTEPPCFIPGIFLLSSNPFRELYRVNHVTSIGQAMKE